MLCHDSWYFLVYYSNTVGGPQVDANLLEPTGLDKQKISALICNDFLTHQF